MRTVRRHRRLLTRLGWVSRTRTPIGRKNTVHHRGPWLAGLAAVAAALFTAATVAAYAGQVAESIQIGVGTIKCNSPITVTATVLDNNGKAISGKAVAWNFVSTPSTSDTISPRSSTTNALGVATTTVRLACIPGNRQLRATADQVSGTAVFGLTEGQVLGITGLPNTTAAPPGSRPESSSGLPLLVMLVVLLGLAEAARRFRSTPG